VEDLCGDDLCVEDERCELLRPLLLLEAAAVEATENSIVSASAMYTSFFMPY